MPAILASSISTVLGIVARDAAPHIVNAAVGSLFLAIVAECLLSLRRKESASTRFVVWMAALGAVVALPLVGNLARLEVVKLPSAGVFSLPERYALYVFGMWAVVTGAMSLKLAIGIWHLRGIRRAARSIDIAGLDAVCRTTVCDFQAIRPVAICTSSSVSVPTAVGFFRPAILLPAWTQTELSPADLNSVLVHELAHLRRYDDWTNLLQKLVRAVFFYCPAVWWIEGQLSLEREMACDEHVLAGETNARAYAECLVSLAEKAMLHRAAALAQSVVDRLQQCRLRVARILDSSASRATRVRGISIAAAAVASVSSLIFLAQLPSLVDFRATPPILASGATSPDSMQPSTTQIPGAFDTNATASPAMVVRAGWQVPANGQQHSFATPAVRRKREHQTSVGRNRQNASIPLRRVEVSDAPDTPATILIVTQRTFCSADGTQFVSTSVYRFAVLPRRDAPAGDGFTPKRI